MLAAPPPGAKNGGAAVPLHAALLVMSMDLLLAFQCNAFICLNHFLLDCCLLYIVNRVKKPSVDVASSLHW